MSAQERYMDTDRVKAIAQGFKAASAVLKVVSGILEVQMMILKTTAFIGLVGGSAVERYLASIKPEIDQLASTCEEIGGDVDNSVRLWLLKQQR